MENRRYKQFNSLDLQVKRRPILSLTSPSSTSPLAKVTPSPIVPVAPVSLASHWLGSGKNLDFCMLAVCSCVLAILCHQTVHLPGSTTATSQLTSSRVFPSQLDFIVKAGLFTSSHSQSEQDEESAE